MFANRYQLGKRIPLQVRCKDGSGTPTLPASAPVVRIFTVAGAFVLSQKIPIVDSDDSTAFFLYSLLLDSRFSVGQYFAVYDYAVGGTQKSKEDWFEVLAGGNADGNGISMYYMRQPGRDFVLVQTDGGLLRRLRNPRLV